MQVDGHYEYYLGNLVGGQQRRLAFLVELPEISDPRVLTFKCTANWLDVDTAMEEHNLRPWRCLKKPCAANPTTDVNVAKADGPILNRINNRY